MNSQERNATINAMQGLAEDLTRVTNSLRALTARNEARGFYAHLAGEIQVQDGEDGEGNPTYRTLDPASDRDVQVPGTAFTLGEVLDFQYALASLQAYLADAPGQSHTSNGFEQKMFGFVTPTSVV